MIDVDKLNDFQKTCLEEVQHLPASQQLKYIKHLTQAKLIKIENLVLEQKKIYNLIQTSMEVLEEKGFL